MIDTLAAIATAEQTQAVIMSWFDFVWQLVQHPLVSLLIGVFGGAHLDGGFRRLYGKGIQQAGKIIPKKKDGA